MSCTSAKTILDFCGPNPGGTNKLFVALAADILSIPAVGPDGVTITGDIVMKATKYFVEWNFAQDTGDINHKSEGEQGNQAIMQEINCYIPRGNAAIDEVINKSLNGKFVVIVTDGLDQKRIGGSLNRPMTFSYDYKSGKKFNDKNGSDFKFTVGTGHVPHYYDGVIPVQAPVV